MKKSKKYYPVIEKIFLDRYKSGLTKIDFERSDIEDAAKILGIEIAKNLGDVIYKYRYRSDYPKTITDTSPKGKEWIIWGRGDAKYCFWLVPKVSIKPTKGHHLIKIPSSSPEIISNVSLSNEQALLAKVRYNRLIDIFLGITSYSLQNHYRTKISDIGQIEIDEIYVGVDSTGKQYIIPIEAKNKSDRHSVIQTLQGIICCENKFPDFICVPISVQFLNDDSVAIFRLDRDEEFVSIFREEHYKFVPADEITSEDFQKYKNY